MSLPTDGVHDDWDPRAPGALEDQLAACDALRRRCHVADSDYLGWTVLRHADVLRVVTDHETFGNVVSTHLSVSHGMDLPEHTPHRRTNARYFTANRMAALEPTCRRIAAELVDALPRETDVEVMEAFARTFALQVQAALMGWRAELHEPLRVWTLANQRATLTRDRAAMSELATDWSRPHPPDGAAWRPAGRTRRRRRRRSARSGRH